MASDKIFSDLAKDLGLDIDKLAAEILDADSPTGSRMILTKFCPSFDQALNLVAQSTPLNREEATKSE